MAIDIFIKIEDIKGESLDDMHKDDIDVLAWSWGISQTGTTHRGAGSGAKVSVQDITITKYVDKATPNLLDSCATGKYHSEALLTGRKAGETSFEYYKLKMMDVLISSIAIGGSARDERLTENVSLNFAKYEVEYTPQKVDGSGDAAISTGFDIAANKKL